MGYDTQILLTKFGKITLTTKSEINDFDNQGNSYKKWLHIQANIQLQNDINNAESNANLLGYTVLEVLDNAHPAPKTKSEIFNNYENSNISYQNWLTTSGQLKLDAEIKSAESNPDLNGYKIGDLLEHNLKPKYKQRLTNFADSRLSYESWLLTRTNNVLNQMISNAEYNANLLGYTPSELRNKTPLPTILSKLDTINDSGISYQHWLNIYAKLLLSIQKNNAEKATNKLGYEVSQLTVGTDSISSVQDLNDFMNTGVSYERWLANPAKSKLQKNVYDIEHSIETYGYSIKELLSSGHGTPTNYTELLNYRIVKVLRLDYQSKLKIAMMQFKLTIQIVVITKLIISVVLTVTAFIVMLTMVVSYVWAREKQVKINIKDNK